MSVCCDVCGGNEYTLLDGFYYCDECNTQSQHMRETVHDQMVTSHRVHSSFIATSQNTLDRSRDLQKKHTEMARRTYISQSEAINVFLQSWTSRLLKLGCEQQLRHSVQRYWQMYLQLDACGTTTTTTEATGATSSTTATNRATNATATSTEATGATATGSTNATTEATNTDGTAATAAAPPGLLLGLALLSLALLQHYRRFVVSDVMRWAREHVLPINSALNELPPDANLANNLFVTMGRLCVTPMRLHKMVHTAAHALQLQASGVLQRAAYPVVQRLLSELALPDALAPVVFNMLQLGRRRLFGVGRFGRPRSNCRSALSHTKVHNKLTHMPLEVFVVCALLAVLKALFGLDDCTERYVSQVARAHNVALSASQVSQCTSAGDVAAAESTAFSVSADSLPPSPPPQPTSPTSPPPPPPRRRREKYTDEVQRLARPWFVLDDWLRYTELRARAVGAHHLPTLHAHQLFDPCRPDHRRLLYGHYLHEAQFADTTESSSLRSGRLKRHRSVTRPILTMFDSVGAGGSGGSSSNGSSGDGQLCVENAATLWQPLSERLRQVWSHLAAPLRSQLSACGELRAASVQYLFACQRLLKLYCATAQLPLLLSVATRPARPRLVDARLLLPTRPTRFRVALVDDANCGAAAADDVGVVASGARASCAESRHSAENTPADCQRPTRGKSGAGALSSCQSGDTRCAADDTDCTSLVLYRPSNHVWLCSTIDSQWAFQTLATKLMDRWPANFRYIAELLAITVEIDPAQFFQCYTHFEKAIFGS